MSNGRSNLEVLLDFLGRPLVWVTVVAAGVLVGASTGFLDLKMLESVLDVLAGFFERLKFW